MMKVPMTFEQPIIPESDMESDGETEIDVGTSNGSSAVTVPMANAVPAGSSKDEPAAAPSSSSRSTSQHAARADSRQNPERKNERKKLCRSRRKI